MGENEEKTYDVKFKVENVCTTSLKDLIETILKISENGEITNIVAIVIVKLSRLLLYI